MSGPTVDLLISADGGIDALADQAQYAEELGYEYASLGETTGWNIVPVLSAIAERTETIGLGDDVISPYSRAPTLIGQTALTLHEISDGRFRLGLGTSSPALAEHWHGADFDRPLRRLRETIDIVREVYSGDRVTYDGEIFQLGGLSYEAALPETPPAIDVSALGPTTVELAGRFADGWIPQLFTPEALRERMDDLRRGAELGDRDAGSLRVSPIVRCCASEDRDTARDLARSHVAFMVGAYGPYYGNSVARQGYPDVIEEIRGHWEENRDTEAMAEALPADLLDSLAAAGTPDEVREWVEDYAAIDGVDAVRVGFIRGMDADLKRTTMRAIAE